MIRADSERDILVQRVVFPLIVRILCHWHSDQADYA